VRLGATEGGGASQPDEQHGLAAEVHMIDRRKKKPGTEGFLINNFRTQYLSKNSDLISGFDQPLPQSVPSYRHAA
jgi:hypothetical protein